MPHYRMRADVPVKLDRAELTQAEQFAGFLFDSYPLKYCSHVPSARG